MRTLTHAEWLAEACLKFGADAKAWKFVCPSCGHVASVQDWKDAGAPEGGVAFSCVGRYTGAGGEKAFKHAGGPCNYTSGGLFNISPVTVIYEGGQQSVFEFAEVSHAA